MENTARIPQNRMTTSPSLSRHACLGDGVYAIIAFVFPQCLCNNGFISAGRDDKCKSGHAAGTDPFMRLVHNTAPPQRVSPHEKNDSMNIELSSGLQNRKARKTENVADRKVIVC
jgi:hypothetical protein